MATCPLVMKDQEPLLTKQELAARLKVTTRCVNKWLQHKQVAVVKIGGLVRFRWSDILDRHLKPKKATN